ncbi:MAG: hypothetical protein U1C71_03350, partial [archaeon]|nr:hypothetical protein [archaeon]
MRIRQATAKDIIPMARLMMDVYSKPPFNARRPLSEAVKSLRYYLKMGHAFVAEERKELVGATVLRVDRFWEGNVLIIEDLAVK